MTASRNIALLAAVALGWLASCTLADEAADVRTALKAYGEAINRGDAAAAKADAVAGEPENAMIDVLAAYGAATARVRDAAVARFGDAGKIVARPLGSTKLVDGAEVKITGATASLQSEKELEPWRLKKVEGRWKVDLTALPRSAVKAAAGDSGRKVAAAVDEVAEEIKAGKYSSAIEAKRALGASIAAAMAPPQTQPAGR